MGWRQLFRRRAGPSNAATVYRTNTHLLVAAIDVTTEDLAVTNGAVELLPRDAPAPDIGAAVLAIARQGRKGVSHPDLGATVITDGMRQVVKALGLRSYRQFVEQANHCDVQLDGERCHLVPSRNGGPTGPDRGFAYMPEQTVVCGLEPEELGRAVLMALDRCEGIGPRLWPRA